MWTYMESESRYPKSVIQRGESTEWRGRSIIKSNFQIEEPGQMGLMGGMAALRGRRGEIGDHGIERNSSTQSHGSESGSVGGTHQPTRSTLQPDTGCLGGQERQAD